MKSDAFLIELDGALWLIDGGMSGSLATRDYLRGLRREWLAASGIEHADGIRLKFDWIVSHFHADHVMATIQSVIPDENFELGTIYLPPDSAMDAYFGTIGADGDTKYRPLLAEALAKRPDAYEKIINIDFGAQNILRFTDGSGSLKFTLYPTPFDGGVGERLQYMIDNYYDGDRTNKMIPVAAVNSCCTMLHIAFGEHTFLFTGDLMKREAYLDNEAADEVFRTYGEQIGKVTLIKYLHHGFRRDAAARLIMGFDPEYILVTCAHETASAALREAFPDMSAQIYNSALRDIIFISDGKRITVRE